MKVKIWRVMIRTNTSPGLQRYSDFTDSKNPMFSMLYSIIPCLFYLEQKLIEQKNDNLESDDDSTTSDFLIAEEPKVSSGKG